jgi:hypothetical protein
MGAIKLTRYNDGLRLGRPRNLSLIPGRVERFSFLHSFQAGPGIHAASYPMGTDSFSPEGKAAGV